MEYIEILLWAGTITFGAIGTYLGITSRIGPRLAYRTRSLEVIGSYKSQLPEEVSILFKDKKVPRITKTFIALWNSGRKTIEGKNIVNDDKLRITLRENEDKNSKNGQILRLRDGTFKVTFSGTDQKKSNEKREILSADIIKKTREANKFEVKINESCPHEAICNFSYLDPGDGALIELLHTSEEYPIVKGTIKELPQGIKDYGDIASLSEKKGALTSLCMDIFFGGFVLFFSCYVIFTNLAGEDLIVLMIFIFMFLMSLLFLSLSLIKGAWEKYRQFPKILSTDKVFSGSSNNA